jgi:hypothetical protein
MLFTELEQKDMMPGNDGECSHAAKKWAPTKSSK